MHFTLTNFETKIHRYFGSIASVASFGIAFLIVISWFFSTGTWFTTDPSVKFNTALCIAVSSIGLFFLNQKKPSFTAQTVVIICSLFILVVSGITLLEYILQWNSGIDQLFWKDTHQSGYPGRMSVTTAILFILLCIVHLLIRKKRFQLVAQIILILGLVLLVLVFLIIVSQIKKENLSVFKASSLHTSLAFILLYLGSFFSYPLSHLHFSFEKRMAGSFSFSILLLTLVYFSIRKTNQRFLQTSQVVEHTHEVLLKAEQAGAKVTEMQNSVRGYFITGDIKYIQAFELASDSTLSYVKQLETIFLENVDQKHPIDSLSKLIEHYIHTRKQILITTHPHQVLDSNIQLATDEGRKLTFQISGLISAIQQGESQLLSKRSKENEESVQNASRVVSLFQIVIALLMIFVFVVMFRNGRKRKKAEQHIIQLNKELEKRVEEKTKEVIDREKHYRFLMENMQEGIQVISYDWRFLFVNNAVIFQSKRNNEELVGYTLMEKYPGIEQTELFKVLQRCMKDRTTAHVENEFFFPDNTSGWFELSIQPVPEGLFILSTDISERKEYIERLKVKQSQLANAQKIAKLARWEWNINENKLTPFSELFELLDLPLKDTVYMDEFVQIVCKEQSEHFQREVYVALDNISKLNTEFLICLQDQQDRYMHIVAEVFCNPEGIPIKYVGTIQDITELKRSEAMLKQLNLNLERRAYELKTSNAELERFAFVASHDLQEPLRMVSSFLGLLESESSERLDAASKEYIRYAVDGAERMKKLIHALLEYSRLDVVKENAVEVDLNQVIKNVRAFLKFSIEDSGAMIEAGSLPIVNGLESQLQQVFQNLISNALKYHNHNKPEINIGAKEKGSFWEFHVSDNGIGIDPKYFDKIFIIFQRLHDKNEYSGTGIGLAICKKIIEKHGGQIWLHSEVGKGSTFYFTLPKALSN
jgi:PAS domain S-box-containing protein